MFVTLTTYPRASDSGWSGLPNRLAGILFFCRKKDTAENTVAGALRREATIMFSFIVLFLTLPETKNTECINR